jgi:low temperature requirement protein LtrA
MTHIRWRDPDAAPAGSVTAVEVFFDVVFVFTLTQLTRTLEEDLSLAGTGRILLVFGALWYMYGGYAWLTNHVPPRRGSQKLVLFGAMAGFFIAALGIPHAFDGTGVLFGVGYLMVICVHLILFTQADVLEGVLRLGNESRLCGLTRPSIGVTGRDCAPPRPRSSILNWLGHLVDMASFS